MAEEIDRQVTFENKKTFILRNANSKRISECPRKYQPPLDQSYFRRWAVCLAIN